MDKYISRFKSTSNASDTSDKCTDDQSCHLDEDSDDYRYSCRIKCDL